jgi:hypothetical protein
MLKNFSKRNQIQGSAVLFTRICKHQNWGCFTAVQLHCSFKETVLPDIRIHVKFYKIRSVLCIWQHKVLKFFDVLFPELPEIFNNFILNCLLIPDAICVVTKKVSQTTSTNINGLKAQWELKKKYTKNWQPSGFRKLFNMDNSGFWHLKPIRIELENSSGFQKNSHN